MLALVPVLLAVVVWGASFAELPFAVGWFGLLFPPLWLYVGLSLLYATVRHRTRDVRVLLPGWRLPLAVGVGWLAGASAFVSGASEPELLRGFAAVAVAFTALAGLLLDGARVPRRADNGLA